MKLSKLLIVGILFGFVIVSCNNYKNKVENENEIIVDDNENIDSDTIVVTGVLHKQGITTYQYGTHTISENNKLYALRSSSLNLDEYLSQNITIVGERIDGYPVDGGPNYLEVIKIK